MCIRDSYSLLPNRRRPYGHRQRIQRKGGRIATEGSYGQHLKTLLFKNPSTELYWDFFV